MSRLKSSRNSGLSSKIETNSPSSGRLDTLQRFEKKIKIWGLQTAGNVLKLSILTSPCYFCIISKSFTIPSGGPFWHLGACTPPPPLPTGLKLMHSYAFSIVIVTAAGPVGGTSDTTSRSFPFLPLPRHVDCEVR